MKLAELEGIITCSDSMMSILDDIRTFAFTEAPVLIEGETGSGKELIARALHAIGPRTTAPFMVVDCAAVPEATAHSELFGHERGWRFRSCCARSVAGLSASSLFRACR